MRETGSVRLRTEGDLAVVDSYIAAARTQLGAMKNEMAAFGLQQLERTVTYSDGTVITCSSIFGQDQISIAAPPTAVASPVPPKIEAVSTSTLEFAYFISPNALGIASFVSALNSPGLASGKTISFGIQNGQIVAIFDVLDEDVVRVDTIARTIKRSDFAIAENLINSLDRNVLLDGALLCDEGFFVDPSIFAGKAYEAALLKLTEPYHYALNHGAEPVPSYSVPDEYMHVWPLFNENFHNAFVTYATPTPPADYRDMTLKSFMTNTQLNGSGGALLSTLAVSPFDGTRPYDDIGPVGTKFYQERLFRTQASNSIMSSRRATERLYIRQEYFDRNYYTVTQNAGFLRGSPETVPGGGSFEAPAEGYLTYEVLRVHNRRTPDGWGSTTETVPRTQVMTCTLGITTGRPPPFITAPPTSADMFTEQEQRDGSRTAYARLPILSTHIRYDGAPQGLSNVFPRPPGGGYAVLFSDGLSFTLREFYGFGDVVPTLFSATSTPLVRSKFSMNVRIEDVVHVRDFTLDSQGHVKVALDGGVPTVDISPLASADWVPPNGVAFANTDEQPQRVEEMNYIQPRNQPSLAAFQTATRVNVTLSYYNPRRVESLAIVPPVSSFIGCVFIARSGQYMYLRLKDASFAGALAYLNACITYAVGLAGNKSGIPAFDNAGSQGERKAAMLDLVHILANTGVSTELAFFFNPFSSSPSVVL